MRLHIIVLCEIQQTFNLHVNDAFLHTGQKMDFIERLNLKNDHKDNSKASQEFHLKMRKGKN